MAKAKVTITCSKCGAEFEVTKLCRNRTDADSFEAWALNHITVCKKCQAKAEAAAKSATASEAMGMDELPALEGSEKQINWAVEIRSKFMAAVTSHYIDNAKNETYRDNAVKALRWIAETKTSAKWWIDNRACLDSSIDTYKLFVVITNTEYLPALATKAEEEAQAEAPAAEEVKEEAPASEETVQTAEPAAAPEKGTPAVSLIPLPEYAARIGRDRSSISKKARNGDFKTAVKVGRNWLIDPNEPYCKRKPGRKPETTTYQLVYTSSIWIPDQGYSTQDVVYDAETVTTADDLAKLLKTIDWSWIEKADDYTDHDTEWTVTAYAADDVDLDHPLARRSVWESDL